MRAEDAVNPLEPLLVHVPPDRPVFVAGKGGVGKSTTAGALALALAHRSGPVRVLSVDPAHSLADLFAVALIDGMARDVCGAPLVVEELDADARAAAWKRGDGAALADLVERGTYLRADEVGGFLEPALPGMDEAMAAFRLAELFGGAERLVVDTAPTGHTLRLLEAADLLAGWSRAFGAMAEKAAAVEMALVRRRSVTPGAAALERLDAAVDRFRDLLEEAVWVVVDRPGSVVAAETERLLARLANLGFPVVARLRVGGAPLPAAGGPPVVVLHTAPPRAGCAGLSAWGATVEAAGVERGPAAFPAAVKPAPEPAGTLPDALAWLDGLQLRLLLAVGKGGAGKTTCACAVALRLAATRPVLLLGTDPAGSLADVLGRPVAPGGARIAPGLRAREVDAPARFAALAAGWRQDAEDLLERVGIGRGAELDRRVLESLWNLAPPGVDELAALAELLEEEQREATVVVDTAPTGHLLRLLAMPATALGWTRALLRILSGLGGAAAMESTVAATLDLARRLRRLQEMLRDPASSAALVVSTDGPLVRAETTRLIAALDDAGVAVVAHVHNRGAAVGAQDGTVQLWAPAEPAPPVGPEALAAFLSRWRKMS